MFTIVQKSDSYGMLCLAYRMVADAYTAKYVLFFFLQVFFLSWCLTSLWKSVSELVIILLMWLFDELAALFQKNRTSNNERDAACEKRSAGPQFLLSPSLYTGIKRNCTLFSCRLHKYSIYPPHLSLYLFSNKFVQYLGRAMFKQVYSR